MVSTVTPANANPGSLLSPIRPGGANFERVAFPAAQ
jgi:hypothetical protein